MSLINCPECGKEISNKSKACINCGFPLEYFNNEMTYIENDLESEILYDENDNIYIQFNNGSLIEIKNGYMTIVTLVNGTTTDRIENFKLDYYAISMGVNVGFSIYNINKSCFTGIIDVVCGKEKKELFNKFKEFMDNHNCFLNRSRLDAIYRLPIEVELIKNEKRKQFMAKKSCPKCGSSNFHSFIYDKQIISGKTKTSYSVNLNPLKPFTFANKKEKVVRNPVTIQVSKFLCDDCGNIFN